MLVAAREATRRVVRPRCLHAVFHDLFRGIPVERFLSNEAAALPNGREAALEQHVFCQSHIHHHRVAVAVHWNVADPRLNTRTDAIFCNITPEKANLATGGLP
ncbi:hypothetical protein SDC9_159331 [bioreactor metagenome]|uniref:Uncharacterized protein n=1 Tax=bioreactor metagenome TaxID=1076179 RepID=A0A645FCG9_9ZZZZ